MTRKFALAAALMIASAATSASAAVVTGAITGGTVFAAGGTFLNVAPPAAVGFDNFDDNNLRAFNEVQNLTLLSALGVDSPSSSIAVGSVISSHLIAFDPAGAQSDPTQPTVSGFVDFDAPVLGVIWRGVTLTATNAQLGAAGVNYLTPVGFGLEQGSDFFTIAPSGNANRVGINLFSATSPGDVMRVITGRAATPPTGAVPEPATWLSMIFGFGLIGGAMRNRSARRALAA
ncbi:MAG: PEPxxWA-CTERM sorting domain-containing protein [Sphingomonadaceae bacterium]